MDLKIVKLKNLQKIYLNFLAICILFIGGSIILYKMGFQLFVGSSWVVSLKNIFLYAMIGFAMLFSFYSTRQKNKLKDLPTFEEKISFYETFYQNRLWWHIIACFISGFLLVLTHRLIFFYFGLFDLLMMLIAYPAKAILKKELNEDELIFN